MGKAMDDLQALKKLDQNDSDSKNPRGVRPSTFRGVTRNRVTRHSSLVIASLADCSSIARVSSEPGRTG